jgi:Family of unknown function (DUF6600)
MFTGMISFMLVRRRLTSAVAALALGLGLSPLAAADPPSRVARLNYVQGSVSFRPGGVEEWAPATVNYPLTIGGDLWVDQGARAELHIGSTAIRLTPQTSFSFLNLDDRTVQIRLSQGSLTVRIQRIAAGEVFEVDTPNGAVTLARPGSYRVDVDSDRVTATVTVRRGEAEIMSAGAILPVRSGEAVFLVGGDAPTYDLREPAPPDEWEAWGSARDAREDQAPALRYVSREITGYEDLDAHGTWRVDATYGAVWTPTAVAVGWAPYRYGHWAWVDPWGWTWIDDAPWGFAPFHYGRWAYISGGWGWIPGTIVVQPVYAPALVAFVGGVNFSVSVSFGGIAGIGWFPLAPREVYVPPYQYSPTYIRNVNVTNVNITNVNVTNINVTNVNYLNRHVPGAVTAVSHDVFVSARPVATAAVLVSPRAATTGQVVGMTAPLAPRHESVFGREAMSGDSRRVVRPPDQVLARPVVARVAPPPAPVPFEVRRKALEAQPGRPLDPRALETLRGKEPSKALLVPAVRPAAPGRDAPEAKHALKPAREGLPAPKPVAVEGFVPAPQPGVAREVVPAPVAPEATGKPGKAPQPGVAREVVPAPVAPEATGKPGKAPQPGVSRAVTPVPVVPGKAPQPGEVSGEEAAPESADKAQPEGAGKGKPKP